MCVGGICCPFCGQVPLGDTVHALRIGGTVLATSVSAGFTYKFKNVWIPKLKSIFKRHE